MFAVSYCGTCGSRNVTERQLTDEEVHKYTHDNFLVQVAFPDHSVEDREIIMAYFKKSHYLCLTCWDNAFKEEE